MELKGKDIYRIECGNFLSDERIVSLYSLYQPLIGTDAVSLYMTMYSEGLNQHSQESHNRLCALMNLSIDVLERARIRLEEYMLVKTYVQAQENRNVYVYVLNMPMNPESFIANKTFMSILTHHLERKQMEVTLTKLRQSHIPINTYKEITRKLVQGIPKAEYDLDVDYRNVSPRYNFADDDQTINFDYDKFISSTSVLVFPAELRTQENLRLIGKLATVHGLSPDRMRILVSKAVNIETMTFDDQKLSLLAQKAQPDITTAGDPYDLPPVSFLQAKQNGAPVSLSDRRILEQLSVEMKFPPDVINVMIEYILKKSQNRLVRTFVEMVAGEWARDGVKTREQAFAETRKKSGTSYPKKQDVLPEYMTVDKEQNTDDTDTSADDIEHLMKGLKKS